MLRGVRALPDPGSRAGVVIMSKLRRPGSWSRQAPAESRRPRPRRVPLGAGAAAPGPARHGRPGGCRPACRARLLAARTIGMGLPVRRLSGHRLGDGRSPGGETERAGRLAAAGAVFGRHELRDQVWQHPGSRRTRPCRTGRSGSSPRRPDRPPRLQELPLVLRRLAISMRLPLVRICMAVTLDP